MLLCSWILTRARYLLVPTVQGYVGKTSRLRNFPTSDYGRIIVGSESSLDGRKLTSIRRIAPTSSWRFGSTSCRRIILTFYRRVKSTSCRRLTDACYYNFSHELWSSSLPLPPTVKISYHTRCPDRDLIITPDASLGHLGVHFSWPLHQAGWSHGEFQGGKSLR